MLFQLFNRLCQRNSNTLFRKVLQTPPLPDVPSVVDSGAVVYTVLNRPNVRAYLFGLKSFLRFMPRMAVVVQDDGSLQESQRRELLEHVPGCTLLTLSDSMELLLATLPASLLTQLPPLRKCNLFVTLKLINVLVRFPQKRVLLFDSDLLCLRPPHEVAQWASGLSPRAFHGGGGNSLAAVFDELGFDCPHVSVARFGAGFFGFENVFTIDDLMPIIERIVDRDASLLHDWEIEQAIWAVLLNRFPDVINVDELRPHYVGSGYRTYRQLRQHATIVHFIGSVRFKNFRYLRLSRRVMRELIKDAAADRLVSRGALESRKQRTAEFASRQGL